MRKAALEALYKFEKEGVYLSETLSEWQQKKHPAPQDFHLIQEIAYGTLRMKKALDFLALQLTEKGIKAKLLERLILRMSLYQHFFMDRIPLYAIVSESVDLAKSCGRPAFASFLNAVLRKLETIQLELPNEMNPQSLSIRLSYPEEFTSRLIEEYGIKQAEQILLDGNRPPRLMARLRGGSLLEGSIRILEGPLPVITLNTLPRTEDSSLYIQNATPVLLIGELAKYLQNPPQKILDMCASPGGKSIAVKDLFPGSFLHANDISDKKLVKLRENFRKFSIQAELSSQPAQKIQKAALYDLILIDAPCSNSGVFNKRPEARWRYSPDQAARLQKTQKELLRHAKSLLAPQGQIWYLTCSILPEENEEVVKGEEVLFMKTVLPNIDGWDGGFGAAIQTG